MFDDLDDIQEFQLDPHDKEGLATELLDAAKNGDAVRERMALGALDDRLEAAIHAAGEGRAATKDEFADTLDLLIRTIQTLATAGMEHFVWEAPGRERSGAALVRRLQSTVNSGTFDRVVVEPPLEGGEPSGVLLMLGRGGTGFDDLQAPEEFWRGRGCAVVKASHCCVQRLKEREIDRILQALVEHGAPRLGLIGHFFSENGSYFWCHIMERWERCPPVGLPPLREVLRGCIYDSCHTFAGPAQHTDFRGAQGDMAHIKEHRAFARSGTARHVTMNATLSMCRNTFGGDDARIESFADITGPLFKGIVEACAHRGVKDDPIFDNGGPDMAKGHLREPAQIPRLVFVSECDTTISWRDAMATVEYMKTARDAAVEIKVYEKSLNCSMHRDDPVGYFGRIGAWLAKIPPLEAAQQ